VGSPVWANVELLVKSDGGCGFGIAKRCLTRQCVEKSFDTAGRRTVGHIALYFFTY
jgi:hypothetical protein